jgi:hypothetical protein
MTEKAEQVEQPESLEGKFKSLYEPARASQMTFEYLRDHPFCDESELKHAAGITFISGKYPEVGELANIIIETRETVRKAYGALQSDVTPKGLTIAEVLFKAAAKKHNYVHEEDLEMSHLDFPFALVLSAFSSDFGHLDPNDVDSYYNPGLKIRANHNSLKIPFIAIRADFWVDQPTVLKHELEHAANTAVKLSLEKTGNAQLWGHSNKGVFSNLHTVMGLYSKWEDLAGDRDREKNIQTDPRWKKVMEETSGDAKDEIIVRLYTDESMAPIYTKGGFYDFFHPYFNISRVSVFKNFLWTKYTELINRQIRTVHSVMETYKFYGMEKRAETIPWILMRIPLDKWEESLNAAGITVETDLLSKIGKHKGKDSGLDTILNQEDKLHTHDLVTYWQTHPTK